MKRLYWTNPDICQTEVKVTTLGDCKVTIDPVIFHPDEGGQPHDIGTIGNAKILNIEVIDGQIIHTLDKPLDSGTHLAHIDATHRQHISSQHTAQHIISGIAQNKFDLNTTGVHIGLKKSTIDFDKKIDWQTAQNIEKLSMKVITENIAVETVFDDSNTRSRFDLTDIQPEMIRTVKIADYDASACCGTHVQRTGDIGMIRFLDIETKKNGSRLYYTAGVNALEFSQSETGILRELRKLSKCSTLELPDIIQKSLDHSKNLTKQLDRLQASMLPTMSDSAQIIEIGSSKVGIWIGTISGKLTAKLAALIADKIEGTGIVIADNNISINSKDNRARDFFDSLAKATGAKGGGSPSAASGRLNSKITTEKIIEILNQN